MTSAPVSPRTTRLLRVPTLAAAQQAIAALVGQLDLELARDTVVIVPSASAAAQLRRTVERLLLGGWLNAAVCAQLGVAPPGRRAALCLPILTTRTGFHALLHARLTGAPPMLDDFTRDALMRAAAHDALGAGTPAPFALRPGILAEMLAFYDTLTRLRRSLDDLERLLVGPLSAEAGTDRGAARLLEQTLFLVAACRAFERRVALAEGLDEHGIRRAAAAGPRPALRHIVVCVADSAVDAAGLWPADFDLLTRLPGLERIDVVATDAMLSAGLDERLEQRLPGIVSCRVDTFTPPPVLRVPDGSEEARWFVSRDREEELHAVAREVKWSQLTGDAQASPPDAHAIVVQRPLPYLYLARHTLDSAGVPWTASDALPLAAEPYAALVDLLMETVLAEGARATLRALLRAPQLQFPMATGRPVRHDDVRLLDEELERASFYGGLEWLCEWLAGRAAESSETSSSDPAARGRAPRIAQVTAALQPAIAALVPLTRRASLSEHVTTLIDWLDRFEAPPSFPVEDGERHRRARAAVRLALSRMREAALAHHDPTVEARELMAMLRRWIEARTFEPRVGEAGVHLMEADAARFADVAHVWVLGAIDGDWPASGRRDIFYPASLLADLGWPRDSDRTTAARAQFTDLLRLAGASVTVSVFTLEDDAIVEPSVLLEELEHAELPLARVAPRPPARACAEDALWFSPPVPAACAPTAGEWLTLREGRAAADPSRFQGRIGAYGRTSHAVTQIDTWVDCPFRYFAQHVLSLDDEREQEPGLPPRERGELVHRIFERFHGEWAGRGRGAITPATIDAARTLFAEIVDEELAQVDAADAAIERTRLLGSAVAPGMGDLVLDLEAERGLAVVERRLEERFEGRFPVIATDGRERLVGIRGKADRIDLLEGGRLDLIDYKTGRAPGRRAVQLPIYAHVAELRFAGHRGQAWKAGAADYVAFRGRPVTRALGRKPEERDQRMREAQAVLLEAVDAIGAGEFPPRPAELRICSWCPYAVVCRKEYVDAVEGEGDGQA